jgi:hypothetical protein
MHIPQHFFFFTHSTRVPTPKIPLFRAYIRLIFQTTCAVANTTVPSCKVVPRTRHERKKPLQNIEHRAFICLHASFIVIYIISRIKSWS